MEMDAANPSNLSKFITLRNLCTFTMLRILTLVRLLTRVKS